MAPIKETATGKEPVTMKLSFQPINLTVEASEAEDTVGQVAARLGLGLDQPCGGGGTCGKCRVQVRNSTSEPNGSELKKLSPVELAAGYRLACQCPLEDGLEILLDDSSAGKGHKILSGSSEDRYCGELQPLVRKKRVCLTLPSVQDPATSLVEILRQEISAENLPVPLPLLSTLPRVFPKGKTVTAVYSDFRLLAVEEGDTTDYSFGVAIDIGTTSLVIWLVDLVTGAVIDRISGLNPQTSFGADVVSRITYGQRTPDGLRILKDSILDSLNEMIGALTGRNHIPPAYIYCAAVAGNTCMEHIFLGLDPASIGRSPYLPVTRILPPLRADSVGLGINSEGVVHMVPNISGYVGGDITAGIEASGMSSGSDITLLVDIGTNNEIVLGNSDFLITCSAAAGPALEGARIDHGMRASQGAVEKVSFDGNEIRLGIIGDSDPQGICGSGLVDLVAEMLRTGVIEKSGKIDESVGDENLKQRLARTPKGMRQFRFWNSSGPNAQDLVFSQKDIREVQLAKGAIATGIEILLERTGLKLDDLDRVLVAGAFGNYLNRENAISIGILPDVPVEKIEYIGNSAVLGAYHALISREDYRHMERLAKQTEYVELSSLKNFQQLFLSNLSF